MKCGWAAGCVQPAVGWHFSPSAPITMAQRDPVVGPDQFRRDLKTHLFEWHCILFSALAVFSRNALYKSTFYLLTYLHVQLDQQAHRGKLDVYQLAALLFYEADFMSLQCVLVSECHLRRHQRKRYARVQGCLDMYWTANSSAVTICQILFSIDKRCDK